MESCSNTRTLEVNGMSGDVCVGKVTAAIKSVPGVTAKSVMVGSASIVCDDQAKAHTVCSAINAAGYKARDLGLSSAVPGVPAADACKPVGAQNGANHAAKPAQSPLANGSESPTTANKADRIPVTATAAPATPVAASSGV